MFELMTQPSSDHTALVGTATGRTTTSEALKNYEYKDVQADEHIVDDGRNPPIGTVVAGGKYHETIPMLIWHIASNVLQQLFFRSVESSLLRISFAHEFAGLGLAIPTAPLLVIDLAIEIDPHHALDRGRHLAADRHQRFDLGDGRCGNSCL